jgi:OFA family oxalate/formate antiporter-like MFS transporter
MVSPPSGLVNGLAIGIFAAGSGIFGPVAGMLVERIGWRATFQILAAIFFVFTMAGAYLLKDPPHGYAAPPENPRRAGRAPSYRRAHPQVLRSPLFLALWAAYALGTTAGTMVISQLVPFARLAGLSAKTAAFAITIGAIGSASGRFFSGWLSDHLGRLHTLRAVIAISMLATPMLYVWRREILAFYVLLFFVYYCYGTQLSVYTALAGDFWGTEVSGDQLWIAAAGVGLCRRDGASARLARLREHRRLSIRVLRFSRTGLRRAHHPRQRPHAAVRLWCSDGRMESV